MVIGRGEIWWADLGEPIGSGPGYRRPVLVVQSDLFNASKIRTVIIAVITKNTDLAKAPGNILITARQSYLPVDSVINVSQLISIDKTQLMEFVTKLPEEKLQKVAEGLKLILDM